MNINLYTDGSCLGNPGAGGWAYVLEWGDYRIYGADGMANTTNNRQELYAVIYGLERIEDKSKPVVVYTDSNYVVKGATEWLTKWKANGWRNSRRKEVVNRELWEHLDQLLSKFDSVTFKWIKAHNGHEWNEFADEMANGAANLVQQALINS
jgi:ribonuclease HI